VAGSSGIQASLGGRYALALFDLAQEGKALDAVAQSLAALKAALATVPDLKALASSPVIGRDAAQKTVSAVAAAMGLDSLTTRFLGVMAGNRRLAELGSAIRAFETLLADHKGEARAEVTSAFPLTKAQEGALAKNLKVRSGRDVSLELNVDPAIMGGLVVKMGSQMIDSSIRTRLNALAQTMKG
jgi:F-type H+-transporting ATPase subunit delta